MAEDIRGVPAPLRAAVALILVEGIALLCAAVYLIYATIVGRPGNVAAALLVAVIALAGAAALAFGARSLYRLHPAARSPMIVIQLLALPVGYSLGFQAGRIGFGAPIMVIALVVLFLLLTPPVREVLYREPPR